MARARSSRPFAPRRAPARALASAAAPPGSALDLALALAVAAVVIVVFHRATGYFFHSDDFEGLSRARGLLPERTGLARLIPWRLYFNAFDRWFGLRPFVYHVASIGTLAASAALVFAWLRAPAGRWAALAAAVFFASHPAHYAAAYWISAIGDPLALLFSLATLLAARASSPSRWAAVPLFALALVSKETALLVPAVVFLDPGRARNLPPARRDPLGWTLAAMSAAMVIYYLVLDPIGTRNTAAQAYAPRLGLHLLFNLLTYAGWCLNFPVVTLRSISDVVEPQVFPAGAALLALLGIGVAWRALRRRGALAGATLWIAMLAPVLPLAQHTYRYYLCGPLAGLALGIAATLAWGADQFGERGRRALPAAAALVALLLGVNGFLAVRNIEFAPFTIEGMRGESGVDRALIAGRVAEGLAATPPPAGSTLRFWSPTVRNMEGLADSVDALGYWESNVRSAMLDGLGVRVLAPQLRAVEFVPRFTPAGDSVWYAIYRVNGSMRAGPASEIGKALAGMGAPK
jgi:hypothetical protein